MNSFFGGLGRFLGWSILWILVSILCSIPAIIIGILFHWSDITLGSLWGWICATLYWCYFQKRMWDEQDK